MTFDAKLPKRMKKKVLPRQKNGKRTKQILVTSALPYIHGLPHLGNIIGSLLPADVFARFCRLKGYKTIYICGSDAHGTPLEVAAFKLGITPKELAYKNHEQVKKLFERFGFSFDNYTITDSETNKETTYEFFEKLFKNGYIIEKETEQAFCENCQRFLPDRWVEGVCPHCSGLGRGDQCDDCGRILEPQQLIEPYCIICKGKKIVFKPTKHLFLDLPKFENEIKQFIESHPEWPENAKKYSLEIIKNLQPRCITRDIKWGFHVPLPWYKDKVFYVWFDALLGYISGTKEYCFEHQQQWENWWKNKKTKLVQFLAKDNIIFHTIVWPAMLIGIKDKYILPSYIASSEFLIMKGLKFSKSRGVGITIEDIFDFREADYWRYALVANYPENKDSEFGLEEFQRRVNELADVIGNFIHRTLTFIKNNYDGLVPQHGKFTIKDKKIIKKSDVVVKKVDKLMSKVKLRESLEEIIKFAMAANVYLNEKEPWHRIKTTVGGADDAKITLYICANICRVLAILLEPYIPFSAEKIWSQLGLQGSVHEQSYEAAKTFSIKPKLKIGEPSPLFKKIDDEELEQWKQKFLDDKNADSQKNLA